MPRPRLALLAAPLLLALPARAIEKRGENFVLSGRSWSLSLDARGSILSSRGASTKATLWKSGADGLWSARLRDGTELRASDSQVTSELSADRKTLTLKYLHAAIEVQVTAVERADGVDWSAQVSPKAQALTQFALPARLRFNAPEMLRLVTPAIAHEAPGLAFKPAFFARQSPTRAASWEKQSVGSSAYTAVFGAPPVQRDLAAPKVALSLSPAASAWLGADASQVLAGRTARVARPMTREQADVVLVDSADGPFLSGSKLGANGGLLWRLGGIVEPEDGWVAPLVAGLVGKIAAQTPTDANKRNISKIAILALKRGPERGDFAGVTLDQWRARLGALPGIELEEITDLNGLERALASRQHAAILNPYGEAIPTNENQTPLDVALKVAAWVKGGGHWIETGGFSFFQALRPVKFFSYGAPYPGSFAHFFHLDGNGSTGALFCVQPQRETGWKALENPALALVPSRWSVGSDEAGAFLDAPWTPFVASASTWQSPISRMAFGGTAIANAQRHARDNQITRGLGDKMAPQLLEKFKRAVLLYYGGDAKTKSANLKYLPPGTLLHFADYLRGGFDKQYPDHLPPMPSFGSGEEMAQFFIAARRAGHLISPYTNPTWWCDNPPGPTFLREGRVALQVNEDKTNTREAYGPNDGWTISMWHPAARAANKVTRDQFTQEFPVDVLFQDQVGARAPLFDFNPASPLPHAYMAGMLAQAQEDSQFAPLSTENGWDHLANWEAQMCGFSFATVPTENPPAWSTFLKDRFAPDTFEVFPLAQAIAHDKVAFLHHDLGQFVTNREVLAWTLALGFNMSQRLGADALASDAPREWLKYLDRVQKTICAPYVGAGLRGWEYLDRDTIAARYGDVSIQAGLKPGAANWRAQSPQVLAIDDGKSAASIASRRADGKFDVWFYGAPQSKARLQLPAPIGAASLRWDGQKKAVALKPKAISIALPARENGRVQPPVALNVAPQGWKAKPKIGLIEMAGLPTPWSKISPAQWKSTLQESRLAKTFGLEIETLSTPSQVLAALQGGPTQFFAIINPHTEIFPAQGRDKWRDSLGAIRSYVENGGQWWATGGYSFFEAAWLEGGAWQKQAIGPAGLEFLGLPIGSGEVDAPPQKLSVEAEGKSWFSKELQAKIAAGASVVNRALPRTSDSPGHIALAGSESGTWIGAYRLNGWGGLWRIGGFEPDAELARAVVLEALEYQWTHAPSPVQITTKYLWHAVVEPAAKPQAKTRR